MLYINIYLTNAQSQTSFYYSKIVHTDLVILTQKSSQPRSLFKTMSCFELPASQTLYRVQY